jgi:hypothetical protein
MRKIIGILLLALLVYFIATQPQLAAETTTSAAGSLQDGSIARCEAPPRRRRQRPSSCGAGATRTARDARTASTGSTGACSLARPPCPCSRHLSW